VTTTSPTATSDSSNALFGQITRILEINNYRAREMDADPHNRPHAVSRRVRLVDLHGHQAR
jgi:hypothetical protein